MTLWIGAETRGEQERQIDEEQADKGPEDGYEAMTQEEKVVGSMDDAGKVDAVKEGGALEVEGLVGVLLFIMEIQ